MEVHVERCQSKGKERGQRVLRPSEDEDRVEEGMRVPALVLNGCGESFVAADEKREKASTHFFADTGLMALLCRHDRVLWLVNMTSTSEKQHYALALIQQLMQHIPDNMRVGLLYDIGCQLEYSISLSRSFMPTVINGPVRWCTILGNGKGLACLMGKAATQGIRLSPTSVCPGPAGQLKHKADEEILKIIELEKLVGARAQMVRSLELQFISNQVHDVESFEIKIADARSQHNNLLETLRRRREGLGVTGHAKLVALQGNVFLQVRMNALAVKTQIRDCLRQRKFELERIERAYHQMVGGYVLMQRHQSNVVNRHYFD
ncbi:hypothetical protein PAXINDRAFT_18412 [Paxillus involutus ATCC 200175]|uniref:Uncharacterized protein n=1 Tax=Paxillus involutus ATCC 200175 TaxID=664439 RepID=A0A0C9SNU9_PAXIN|nr:hypothetical protein PAXINDRAFT_18412 [Paxillus involutus ATCC 200175]